MSKQTTSNTLPIIVMFMLFSMISFVTGFQNPMGVIVKDQFHASNFLSQLGNAANFIAYAFMGVPAGILLKRKGYKFTALAAVTVGFIGVGILYLSGIAESFPIYLIGAFVGGFSMCMLNVVVNPMLNTLGGEGKKGNQLIQFGGAFNSISATIVPVIAGYLIGNKASMTISDANPLLFIAMGIFAFAFIVLALVKIPEPHIEKKVANKPKDKYSPLSFRHFTLGAIAIFDYVGIEVGIPNMANLFMTTSIGEGGLGIDKTIAGTVVGTYWFLMFIGRLLGGIVGGKVSSRTMLSVMSAVAIVFIAIAMLCPASTLVKMPVFNSNLSFGFAEVPISIMFFALCGLCTSIMWGSIFNLAVEGPGKYTAAASGIFLVMVCGGGILPLIQGFVADTAGFSVSFWDTIVGAA